MYALFLHPFRLFQKQLLVLTVCILCTVPDAGAVDIEQTASTLFKSFTKNNSIDQHLDIDSTSAIAVQDFYIALLRPTWGMDVGYSALATDVENSAFDPPTGVLLENMFTGTRAIIDRSLGIDMQAAAELFFSGEIRPSKLGAWSRRGTDGVAFDHSRRAPV